MSRAGVTLLVVGLFSPVLLVTAFWRLVAPGIVPFLAIGSLVWLVVFLAVAAAIRIASRKKRVFKLALEGASLTLGRGKQVFAEFNLAEAHRLLAICKTYHDRRSGTTTSWVDLYMSQGKKRLSLGHFMSLSDSASPAEPGSGPRECLCLIQERAGFLPPRHDAVYEVMEQGLWGVVEKLDGFSPNNELLPEIERIRAGRATQGQLRKLVRGMKR